MKKIDYLSKEEKSGPYKKWGKRIVSIVFSIIGLPFVLISFLVFAPIIKLSDGGDVFYKSERLGKNGVVFTMYKYRSMRMNAPVIKGADGSTCYKEDDDPRVTRIGKFMRKFGVDELPQIWNIIKGDMSFIGPRPDLTNTIDRLTGKIPNPLADITPEGFYEDYYKARMSVRPGITGYAVIKLPDGTDRVTCDEADAWYARNLTLKLDADLFFGTIWHLISGNHK